MTPEEIAKKVFEKLVCECKPAYFKKLYRKHGKDFYQCRECKIWVSAVSYDEYHVGFNHDRNVRFAPGIRVVGMSLDNE